MSWFARQKTQKIAKGVRSLIIIFSLLIAIILVIGGRVLFSLPLFFLALSALKIKGLTAIQIFQLWRLIQYLRNSGRFSYYGRTNQTASDRMQPAPTTKFVTRALTLGERRLTSTIEARAANDAPVATKS